METNYLDFFFNRSPQIKSKIPLCANLLAFIERLLCIFQFLSIFGRNINPNIFFMFLIALLFSQTAYAQVTKRFIPNSGSWNVANNWSPSGIPTADDFIVFPSTVTSFSNVPNNGTSIRSLTIEGNAGVITFGGVTNNGTLIIREGISVQSGRTMVIDLMTLLLDAGSSSFVAGTVELNSPGNSGNSSIEVNGEFILTHTGLITQSRSGSFSVNSGATLRICSTNGINLPGNETGNVLTSTKNPITLTNANTTNDPFLLRVADGPNTLANNNQKLINRQWNINKETPSQVAHKAENFMKSSLPEADRYD